MLRVGVNGLAKVGLRRHEVVLIELQGPQNRVNAGPQQIFVSVDFVGRSSRREYDVSVDGLQGALRRLPGFIQALVLVEIGVPGTLGQHLSLIDESFRVIRIKGQSLARHIQHLVGIVRVLITAHRGFVQDDAQFAVGELGCEIVSSFLDRGGIGIGAGGLERVKFGLGLGLWRVLGRSFLGGRVGFCRRVLLSRGRILRLRRTCLRERERGDRQNRARDGYSLHEFSFSVRLVVATKIPAASLIGRFRLRSYGRLVGVLQTLFGRGFGFRQRIARRQGGPIVTYGSIAFFL